jgi:hypothetical protein
MAASAASAARPAAATAPARHGRSAARPAPRGRVASPRSPRARSVARPARRPSRASAPARLVPIAVGRTAGAVSGLAESGLVHRLTRGRLWIGALTTLLVGIVALNVMALSFNAGASKTGKQADVLRREISILRGQLAEAGASTHRIQAQAAALGMIVPEPGSITYLKPKPGDAATAAKRLASGQLATGTTPPTDPAAVAAP